MRPRSRASLSLAASRHAAEAVPASLGLSLPTPRFAPPPQLLVRSLTTRLGRLDASRSPGRPRADRSVRFSGRPVPFGAGLPVRFAGGFPPRGGGLPLPRRGGL